MKGVLAEADAFKLVFTTFGFVETIPALWLVHC